MTVSIVTDSAATLPEDLAAERGVTRVPVWLVVGGEQVRETQLTGQQVLDRWDEGISTSAPTPEDFAEVIEDRMTPDGVLVLTVSSALTGINQSAQIAARDVDGPVRVMDTGTGVGAEALIVLAAARSAAGGASLEEVEAEAQRVARETLLVATLGDLSHLVRSGRVPGIARWAGRQLNLNPIVELGAGKVRPLRPAFNRDTALERIVARIKRNQPDDGASLHVVAFHSMDPEPAEHMLKQVTSTIEPGEAFVGEFGPAMVTHAGPGVVGMSWWWERDGVVPT